ncbi:hypothetical protein [Paraburkholderia atlantica]|uniref:Uncharacterized protein n=1 Tax=Paraburkholderia atlantica TaxID=2654982 RepID=D5WES6_PARAM|nr:hypothetical protein [Paraburkholderia atlantica]ADG19201.1 hypothetical protein BC1002_5263 [Paraburkholderia atlantica]MBB5505501.1 hypothetical protein [Paraburkholderia atlantica]
MNNELASPEAALAPTPTLREIFGGFLGLGLILLAAGSLIGWTGFGQG